MGGDIARADGGSHTVILSGDDPLAVAAIDAVQRGELDELTRLLADHPRLARADIGDHPNGMSRTLLHAATDWPGHFPSNVAVVRALIDAGADANAGVMGPHTELRRTGRRAVTTSTWLTCCWTRARTSTPFGAVIASGTPLADATAFGQWDAARRLIARGAVEVDSGEAARRGQMCRT